MRHQSLCVMTAALAFWLPGMGHARPDDGRLLQFVLDIGSVQNDAVTVRSSVPGHQWAAVSRRIQSIADCERRIQAHGGVSRRQTLATLHRDVLLLQAAGAAHDAGRVAASTQTVADDAAAVVAQGQHID